MAPKKSQATQVKAKSKQDPHLDEAQETSKQEVKDQPTQEPESKTHVEVDPKPQTNGTSKKRKSPSTQSTKPQAKALKTGSRTSSRTTSTSLAPTPSQLLTFLLSDASLPYCYPSDEQDSHPKKSYSRTPPTELSPFEHLLTASLLSKPLSHTLGMRSTRTLLNAPFSLNTPGAIAKAGEKRVWEALEAARTQHRQKTASYIYQMGQMFSSSSSFSDLQKIASEDGVSGVQQYIKTHIKGMGVTGSEIFCRRVQCVEGWRDLFPYADPRAIDAMRELGLNVKDAGELGEWAQREVGKSKTMELDLVRVLDRAVGCALEGKLQEMRREAAKG